jgi:cytosine/adenosine deaminase-related metal-dependent hydrolase
MKHLSAQYIFTNNGPPLERAILTTEEDGTILGIEDTGGYPDEKRSVEFYNGIIIPGFVNCHCHLELSHMKGSIARGTGLGVFLELIRNTRESRSETIVTSAATSDNDMCCNGIVLCADVCNTSASFDIKKLSRIKYINMLEVFGIDPDKANRRLDEILSVAEKAGEMNLPYSLVPHSAYSMSITLLRLLRGKSDNNNITSIHFMETPGEEEFLKNHTGSLMKSYRQLGLIPSRLETVKSHSDAVMNEVTLSGNLILVHNTFVNRETIRRVKERGNLFWCLCPNSNMYIENEIPPVRLLVEEGCEIVMGTDSLASNNTLSILEELKTLQQKFPSLSLEELVCWATANGARALNEEEYFGKIKPGKKPGLLLLQDVDLLNMKLLPESSITRLI